jgi:hypothetical protein
VKQGKREAGKEGSRERVKQGKREAGKEGKRERGKEGRSAELGNEAVGMRFFAFGDWWLESRL